MSDFQLGLIGHPVEHSMSPAMHNRVFDELSVPYRYGLFDVDSAGLGDFIDKIKEDMIGINVTIPHKVTAISFLDEISREAELIGAVNTIKFEGGRVLGYNTDGVGCVKALSEEGVDVKGKRILIIGAGGAARAIGFQATLDGASVSLSNRMEEKQMATNLAEDIMDKTGETIDVIDLEPEVLKARLLEFDVLVHATPVGMHPNVDGIIIPPEILPEDLVVMDIVYNPVETRLLAEAAGRGCTVVDGVGMLVNQGAASEYIWLGIEPPVEIMREAVYEQLEEEQAP